MYEKEMTPVLFSPRDPISALTHFIAFLAMIPAAPMLLVRAAAKGMSEGAMIALSIFAVSMVLLYGASASYHAFQLTDRGTRVLKKLDHIMIYYLIAGTYTPLCVIVLSGTVGRNLLLLVWAIALAGTVFALCWITCPKWVSSIIYIAMGWCCVTAMREIVAGLSAAAMGYLVLGGIAYTIGGVIYAIKPKRLSGKAFGVHEIFHIFVMVGSLFHFLCMCCIV